MKSFSLFFFIVLSAQLSAQQTTSTAWQKMLLFTKNQMSAGAPPLVSHIDTFGQSGTVAFYGNFDNTYTVQDNTLTLAPNTGKTSLLNGLNAGIIAFDPDYPRSGVLNHWTLSGTEYVGIDREDSTNVAHFPVMYLKNGAYTPETSIKFSGKVFGYPIGVNKVFFGGNYFNGWDNSGPTPKVLASASIWDKTKGTLTRVGDGIGGTVKKVSLSNKDGTLVMATGASNIEYNLRILFFGGDQWQTYTAPPPGGRFIDVYCLDKEHVYLVWQNTSDKKCKLFCTNLVTNTLTPILDASGSIASITGDGAAKMYFIDVAARRIVECDLSANNKLTNLADIPSITDYKNCTIAWKKDLYLIDDNRILFGEEVLYQLKTPSALPVTLLNFNGKTIGAANALTWSTSQEQNANRFEIERSTDGTHFALIPIGTVTAKGNSTVKTDYSFYDRFPLSGLNFYRLKTVDLDGKFAYSPIVKLGDIDASGNTGFKIYPNPVQRVLTLTFPERSFDAIVITNSDGKSMRFKSSAMGPTSMGIDIENFPPGMYTIQFITSSSNARSIKFIKQ